MADAPTAANNPTSITFSYDFSTPTPIDDLIARARSDLSGSPVPREQALTVPAVLRGRNLMCSIATLPLVTRDRERMLVRSALLEQIDPDVANVITLSQTVEDLVFDGIAWWHVLDRDPRGWPRSAMHLDVGAVSVQPPPGERLARLRALPSGTDVGGVVWVDGQPVAGRDVIRFDSPNPGLRKAAARAIRRALLLEQAAALYARDPRAQDYFTPAEGADPVDDDEVTEILDEWRASRRERSTAYVPAALTYHTVDAMSPADLQLVELQKQAVLEIANALGLDAEDLQVSTTSRTYANATDRRRDRINDTLSPYMRAITDRLSMNDVTRRGHTVGFDLDDYMRADPTTRWNTYQVGLSNQILSVPEVREMEGLAAVPVEPTPQPRRRPALPPVDQQQEPRNMTRPAATVRFTADQSHEITFDLSEVDAEFRVNREQRTVAGLLVPWRKIAGDRLGMAKWRFEPNSLTWSRIERVKLNRDHNRTRPVGVATGLRSTTAGLEGTFKIARGADGDEVLSLAEDGVLDGFSIEADFRDGDWARDPDDDLVRVVRSGRLTGAAITASPAFDDARVSRVAATRRGAAPMPTDDDERQAERRDQLEPAVVAAFTDAVTAFTQQAGTWTDALTALVGAQQEANERPAVVDPTRRTAQFQVTEEPLYRFDGSRGEHDFSTDVIAMAKKDHEAEARVIEWIKANFVTAANVASLNPARQRPDLYVDQLEFPTPLWDAINKGTLSDNTPFVLPKFNTSSGLVSDHVEGVEPAAGAFTTTSQTITPTAVSGRVEITREAWDQGGNPQLSVILWRQIVREYYEELEQAAATMLNGLSVTQVTLTTAGTDAQIVDGVKGALAALHFVRGGFRFRDFKLEAVLYQKLANAKDGQGRPMFPVLGATNADGMMGPLFGAIEIAGLAGMPAWALPSTPGAANNSYLFNREDVHGWASAPQRLDFEYRVAFVDVGVWGYKALACTRTDGVRRFIYDSVV